MLRALALLFTFADSDFRIFFILPTVNFPALEFHVNLQRRLSFHLLQTFIPSALFVWVGWLSFLVPPEVVPGRMVLTITTLLTLTAMFNAVR